MSNQLAGMKQSPAGICQWQVSGGTEPLRLTQVPVPCLLAKGRFFSWSSLLLSTAKED